MLLELENKAHISESLTVISPYKDLSTCTPANQVLKWRESATNATCCSLEATVAICCAVCSASCRDASHVKRRWPREHIKALSLLSVVTKIGCAEVALIVKKQLREPKGKQQLMIRQARSSKRWIRQRRQAKSSRQPVLVLLFRLMIIALLLLLMTTKKRSPLCVQSAVRALKAASSMAHAHVKVGTDSRLFI